MANTYHIGTGGAESICATHIHCSVIHFVQGSNVVSAFHLQRDPVGENAKVRALLVQPPKKTPQKNNTNMPLRTPWPHRLHWIWAGDPGCQGCERAFSSHAFIWTLSTTKLWESTSKTSLCKDSPVNDLQMWRDKVHRAVNRSQRWIRIFAREIKASVRCLEGHCTNLSLFSFVRALPLLLLSHSPVHLHQHRESVLSQHEGTVSQPRSTTAELQPVYPHISPCLSNIKSSQVTLEWEGGGGGVTC